MLTSVNLHSFSFSLVCAHVTVLKDHIDEVCVCVWCYSAARWNLVKGATVQLCLW